MQSSNEIFWRLRYPEVNCEAQKKPQRIERFSTHAKRHQRWCHEVAPKLDCSTPNSSALFSNLPSSEIGWWTSGCSLMFGRSSVKDGDPPKKFGANISQFSPVCLPGWSPPFCFCSNVCISFNGRDVCSAPSWGWCSIMEDNLLACLGQSRILLTKADWRTQLIPDLIRFEFLG